jgi:DNA-binding NtrC family response regulator
MKQCIFVNRDCVQDLCEGWTEAGCFAKCYITARTPSFVTEEADGSERAFDFTLPKEGIHLDDFMSNIECQIIVEALNKMKGSKTKAADFLNVSFDSLRYRIDRLGISDEHRKFYKKYNNYISNREQQAK